MNKEKGQISVNTENIFPIIRKWLYSDRDIFLRELVSNAADAIAKLERLEALGEFTRPDGDQPKISVEYDSDAGTLVIEDNGIGMTAEEIRKYINQIAFSGVMDFVEKYKDKGAETEGIIGHFGLGFYSAFMVSDRVRIETLSFQADAAAASWESDDGMAYEMGDCDRAARGSRITLTLTRETAYRYQILDQKRSDGGAIKRLYIDLDNARTGPRLSQNVGTRPRRVTT